MLSQMLSWKYSDLEYYFCSEHSSHEVKKGDYNSLEGQSNLSKGRACENQKSNDASTFLQQKKRL